MASTLFIASDQKPDGSWVLSCPLCSDCRDVDDEEVLGI